MKHLSTNRVLFISLLTAISTIILVEFIFNDVQELFSGGAKLGKIFVNMSLSYIAAYFFYIITFLIPKHIERKHIEEHAAHLINKVLFNILFIMQDATNMKISQKDLKLKKLTEDEFKGAMSNVFSDNKLKNFRAGDDGYNIEVGEAVINNINNLKDTVNELFKYSPYIETELISLISAAIRNNMNESWPNSYRMGPVHIGGKTLVAVRRDVSHYARNLFEYSQLYRAIENIFIRKYSKTETVKKYAENINNLQKS